MDATRTFVSTSVGVLERAAMPPRLPASTTAQNGVIAGTIVDGSPLASAAGVRPATRNCSRALCSTGNSVGLVGLSESASATVFRVQQPRRAAMVFRSYPFCPGPGGYFRAVTVLCRFPRERSGQGLFTCGAPQGAS